MPGDVNAGTYLFDPAVLHGSRVAEASRSNARSSRR